MPPQTLVFRDGAEMASWLVFRQPRSVVTTNRLEDIIASLQQVEAAVARGAYAAGFISYEAAAALETALSNDPSNAQARAYLGDIELKRDNLDKAFDLLTRAVREHATLRIAFLDLGVIHTQRKEYKEAQLALQRAEKLDPSQPDVHYRLGRLYQVMDKTELSQQEFAKVRQLHQKDEEDVTRKMSGTKSPASSNP